VKFTGITRPRGRALFAADVAEIATVAPRVAARRGHYAPRANFLYRAQGPLGGRFRPALRNRFGSQISHRRLAPAGIVHPALQGDEKHAGGLGAEELFSRQEIERRLQLVLVGEPLPGPLRGAVFVIHHPGAAIRRNIQPVYLPANAHRIVQGELEVAFHLGVEARARPPRIRGERQ
jgi:hypothetical protein